MRAIWSGTISFCLVSVPVRVFSATESKELRFHFLHRDDLTPIGYDKVRKDTGESVDPDEIVRGFEIEKGRYVPLEDEDLDRLDIELTHSIDICDFVDLDEIDPIYFRKAYYLLPDEGAEKPYRLLVRALEETGKVGIAKVVIRNKQHLAALRPYDDVLLLETMYYADEVRKPESVNGKAKLQKAEVDMAKSLVENLSDSFEPEKYDDTYRKELLDLIKAKANGASFPSPPRKRRLRSST
ncbi:MAG: Ku protein [Actinomycetota bacterium]